MTLSLFRKPCVTWDKVLLTRQRQIILDHMSPYKDTVAFMRTEELYSIIPCPFYALHTDSLLQELELQAPNFSYGVVDY